eukprot:TRINITY_DN16925_c0_g2_i1.p1 TRINITY_DN16925_c0_g2~~TRINITY_DN16925_c0_g2_i1.p1  ORF type:complete len:1122 (+),score=194.85 TRINITY_DN16925_c0_g2_i1:124-3489(+)
MVRWQMFASRVFKLAALFVAVVATRAAALAVSPDAGSASFRRSFNQSRDASSHGRFDSGLKDDNEAFREKARQKGRDAGQMIEEQEKTANEEARRDTVQLEDEDQNKVYEQPRPDSELRVEEEEEEENKKKHKSEAMRGEMESNNVLALPQEELASKRREKSRAAFQARMFWAMSSLFEAEAQRVFPKPLDGKIESANDISVVDAKKLDPDDGESYSFAEMQAKYEAGFQDIFETFVEHLWNHDMTLLTVTNRTNETLHRVEDANVRKASEPSHAGPLALTSPKTLGTAQPRESRTSDLDAQGKQAEWSVNTDGPPTVSDAAADAYWSRRAAKLMVSSLEKRAVVTKPHGGTSSKGNSSGVVAAVVVETKPSLDEKRLDVVSEKAFTLSQLKGKYASALSDETLNAYWDALIPVAPAHGRPAAFPESSQDGTNLQTGYTHQASRVASRQESSSTLLATDKLVLPGENEVMDDLVGHSTGGDVRDLVSQQEEPPKVMTADTQPVRRPSPGSQSDPFASFGLGGLAGEGARATFPRESLTLEYGTSEPEERKQTATPSLGFDGSEDVSFAVEGLRNDGNQSVAPVDIIDESMAHFALPMKSNVPVIHKDREYTRNVPRHNDEQFQDTHLDDQYADAEDEVSKDWTMIHAEREKSMQPIVESSSNPVSSSVETSVKDDERTESSRAEHEEPTNQDLRDVSSVNGEVFQNSSSFTKPISLASVARPPANAGVDGETLDANMHESVVGTLVDATKTATARIRHFFGNKSKRTPSDSEKSTPNSVASPLVDTRKDAVDLRRLERHRACDLTLPLNRRILLLPLAAPYHGNLALEELLMSSGNVATLCSAGSFQCSGSPLMMRSGYCNGHVWWPGSRLEKLNSRKRPCTGNMKSDWNYTHMLDLYSAHWDLRKPILMEKTPNQFLRVKEMHEALDRISLPAAMAEVGIRHVDPVYMIVWRPLCLYWMSAPARDRVARSSFDSYAMQELLSAEQLVLDHRWLVRKGARVIVVSYADLLWDVDRVKRRVEVFTPCLGHRMDETFVPALGFDIFKANQWVSSSLVRAFAAKTAPGEFGYDMKLRSCQQKPGRAQVHNEQGTFQQYVGDYGPLNGTDLERSQAAVAYLRELS